MANVRDLKKDINYVIGDIIEAAYVLNYANSGKDAEKVEAIVDEAINTFDELIEKVNAKGVENKKAHFKAINAELETKGHALIEKINGLN
ncbi:MAG TPA: hypothetical protein VNJ50_14875 [Gelidibacter sp.]|uniref:hypothetical protein n=1 Tax=Gelidibacter sp. TaxID=2018083 RepID=UPI002C503B8C|nr:hypothetical protein [Gelidibacter sp.]HXK00135.1 hypothetical protein [Gelidibacter sp.]